jgi:hypothetical protein
MTRERYERFLAYEKECEEKKKQEAKRLEREERAQELMLIAKMIRGQGKGDLLHPQQAHADFDLPKNLFRFRKSKKRKPKKKNKRHPILPLKVLGPNDLSSESGDAEDDEDGDEEADDDEDEDEQQQLTKAALQRQYEEQVKSTWKRGNIRKFKRLLTKEGLEFLPDATLEDLRIQYATHLTDTEWMKMNIVELDQ